MKKILTLFLAVLLALAPAALAQETGTGGIAGEEDMTDVIDIVPEGIEPVTAEQLNEGTWSVEGTNLVLTILGKSIKINANLSGGNLQLAMNADKMLTLLNAVTTQASALSSSFGTLTSLLKKYDGVHLGLKFAK